MVLDPEDIEWDEANREHATRHGISVEEITQALLSDPTMRRNRKGRSGDYYALGATDGRTQGRGGGCLGPGAADPPADHRVGAVMIEKQPEQMTEPELADYYYAHRDDPDMLGEQVKYVPPRAARVAVRLSFEEEDRIRQAAQSAGMSVSAFLRQAGLSAARADIVNLERLRRDVNEARARIDDAWQALE